MIDLSSFEILGASWKLYNTLVRRIHNGETVDRGFLAWRAVVDRFTIIMFFSLYVRWGTVGRLWCSPDHAPAMRRSVHPRGVAGSSLYEHVYESSI